MYKYSIEQVRVVDPDIVAWATRNQLGVRCPLRVKVVKSNANPSGRMKAAYRVERNSHGMWQRVAETGWHFLDEWMRLDPVQSIRAALKGAQFAHWRAIASKPTTPAPTGLVIVFDWDRKTDMYIATATYMGVPGWNERASAPESLVAIIDAAWGLGAHFKFADDIRRHCDAEEAASFHGFDEGDHRQLRLENLLRDHYGLDGREGVIPMWNGEPDPFGVRA